MDLLLQDFRFAVHSLRAHPGFALVAILTLALGIGATTAIFSVVNGVLLQPLPLHDPDRLVMVWESRLEEPGHPTNVISPANYTDWRKETPRVFSSFGATFDWEMSLTGQAEPEVVRVGFSDEHLFPTLAVRPLLGRAIEKREDSEHAVLSHHLWQRKFGGDPKAIGKRIEVDGNPLTITGIMPREFFVPKSRADLWIFYPVPPTTRGRYLSSVGRLKPGVTLEQAQAFMATVGRRLELAHPEANTNHGIKLVPIHEEVVGDVRRVLLVVFAAVTFLLLIACVNIANLLLSRATARAKEMAVRSALGASRGILVRQLLTESLILAVVAGIVGVVIAGWATMLLVRFTPVSAMLPRTAEIGVDGRVLATTAVLTLITGVFFGLAPAIAASRPDLQTGLKSGGRGSSQSRRGKLFRNTLVAVEVALATVLLIGAGLLIKSFAKLDRVQPGVRAEGALTTRIVLSRAQQEPGRRKPMVERIFDTTTRVPGVTNAGAILSLNMPFTGSRSNHTFLVEGEPAPKEGQEPETDIRIIAGDYFGAMGMPMLAGRAADRRAGERPQQTEFVVNETFARKYFGGKSPVGRRISVDWFELHKGEIVGVVGDVRAAGLNDDPAPAIYMSYLFDPTPALTLIVRTDRDPKSLQVPIARALRRLDPLMPVSHAVTLEELISSTIARPRFNATMLALFAALGLLLASIGIYGVLSYSVSQRTQEMGIRMALGADPKDVRRLVVRDGLRVAGIGIAAGIVVALFTTKLMETLLYGVEARDVYVFAFVAAVLALVAFAASYIPARRATLVNPMIALRPE
ncbi:MAG TPA: ABC transporter permease [Thermoanaerobaculia bacterium]|nr:ABC transporter permease [Thermoanaerobaculia bacterium]